MRSQLSVAMLVTVLPSIFSALKSTKVGHLYPLLLTQGVVTPIGPVLTSATAVKMVKTEI